MTQTKRQLIFLILISGLLFVSTVNVQARQSQKIFTTVSTGTKVIASEFSPKIKKEAVSSALKSSVERAVSEVLTSELFASNLGILYGNVLANPSKYILNYSVIAELKEDTKYVAAVKARIDLTLLKKNLKKYGVIKNHREKPMVLLLISEQSEQDVLPKHWWGKNPLPYESLVTNEIIKFMNDEEFVAIGNNTGKIDLKKYGIVFNSISDTSAAIKLGLKLKADLVITGTAKSFEALNRMGEEKIYEADIVLDMFNVNTKKKITTFELKATANNLDNVEGNKKVLVEVGKLAAEEIITGANKYWEENILKKEQNIETRIEGEDYLSSFILLRKALNGMEGVKSVQTKELGADQAVVSILFKGNAEKLAQALLLKTFNSFGIELYNVKDKSFTIKFVSK
ncbi:MAG: hypothetical protein KAJ62_03895 [Desulfobacteraceae bacterium]|nr:hypothetical protein [Desulfobacteraceae bacterium]